MARRQRPTIMRTCVVACVVACVGLAQADAQPARGMAGNGPMYDTTTEATFLGTVESVEQSVGQGRARGGRGRRRPGGTHIVLQTDVGPLEVHLGPTTFLAEKNIAIVAGDALQILGSRVSVNDESFVVAREITKGDQTWTLRDASGRPLWSGGRR